MGLRANWKAGTDPLLASLMSKAENTTDNAARGAIYQTIQTRLNDVGPFIPLLQPAEILATQKSITGFHYNPIWQTDFNVIGK